MADLLVDETIRLLRKNMRLTRQPGERREKAEAQHLVERARQMANENLPEEILDGHGPVQDRLQENQVEAWDYLGIRDDGREATDETMTLDPSIQPAGEEIVGLSEEIRARLEAIPEAVRLECRTAHHQLGHSNSRCLLTAKLFCLLQRRGIVATLMLTL